MGEWYFWTSLFHKGIDNNSVWLFPPFCNKVYHKINNMMIVHPCRCLFILLLIVSGAGRLEVWEGEFKPELEWDPSLWLSSGACVQQSIYYIMVAYLYEHAHFNTHTFMHTHKLFLNVSHTHTHTHCPLSLLWCVSRYGQKGLCLHMYTPAHTYTLTF